MKAAAAQAVKEIEAMKSNKIIMKFVTEQAYVAAHAEMKAAGSSITLTGVKVAALGKSETGLAIRAKVKDLINAGLIGCLMTKYAADSLENPASDRAQDAVDESYAAARVSARHAH